MAYLCLLAPALGWPGYQSTYLLGQTPFDLDSLVTDENTKCPMLVDTHRSFKRKGDGRSWDLNVPDKKPAWI